MIKDGFITATKYVGGSMMFAEPHVIVFANFLPNVYAMSLDRWEVRVIEHPNKDPEVTRIFDGYELAEMMKEEEEIDPDASWGDAVDYLSERHDDACLAASSSGATRNPPNGGKRSLNIKKGNVKGF